MASSKDFLDYIMDQLSELNNVAYRYMMGEYIIYYQGKIIGGIYDNRFLIKPTETAKKLLPNAPAEKPYEHGKEMILVEETDDKEFLSVLFNSIVNELPDKTKRIEK